ncbi:MAG: hypothetical protein KJ630_01170 [Proteobacteria bacterium]|nr:hypothetical protein [Pseudomonadota bacterium]
MISLDTITLPTDLWWEDETDWTPVDQETEYSTTGALLVDLATKQAGRPITLVGDRSTAWVSRTTVLALMALAADPGLVMTLIIDTRSFQVMFRHEGKPVDAVPVVRISPPAATDFYYLNALRFLMLSENL